MVDLLDGARRGWWSIGLGDVRPAEQTYGRFEPGELPRIDPQSHSGLEWLRGSRPQQWSITDVKDQHPARPFDRHGLAGLGVSCPLPDEFLLAVAEPALLHGVRSFTGCYLDLGEFAMPVDEEAGGVLIHVLSDQQWVLHWLLYVNTLGQEAVVVTEEPIGFDSPEDFPTLTAPLRLEDHPVEVCADSFGEFLYRFWIENEIAFRPDERVEAPLDSYLEHYRLRE